MSRDSFVFYRSFYEALKGMDKDIQADCLMALAQYALDGETATLIHASGLKVGLI